MLNKILSACLMLASLLLLPNGAVASEKKALARDADFRIQACRYSIEADKYEDREVLKQFESMAKEWKEYYVDRKGNFDLQALLKAVSFAAHQHQGQRRRDGATPLLQHLIQTNYLLWDEGKIRSVNVLIAALLHHTLKDSNTSLKTIEENFGSCVRRTLEEIGPQLADKQKELTLLPNLSLNGQLIRLASRLDSLSQYRKQPGMGCDQERQAYLDFSEKILQALRGTNKGLEEALEKEIRKF